MRTILGFVALTWLTIWVGALPHRGLLGDHLLRDGLATLVPLAVASVLALRPVDRPLRKRATREELAWLAGLIFLGGVALAAGHPIAGAGLAGLGLAIARPSVEPSSSDRTRTPRIAGAALVALVLLAILWPGPTPEVLVEIVSIPELALMAAQQHVGALLLLTTFALLAVASTRGPSNDEVR